MFSKQLLWIGLVLVLAGSVNAQPFTYQGYLREGGLPANGTYDFRFSLYDAPSGGNQIGINQFANDLSVQNGLFTTAIDFGAVWTGVESHLEVAVRPGSSAGEFTILTPRVKINPTPYAIRAISAGTANPIGAAGGDLGGTYPNPTLVGLQTRPVSSTAPNNNQVLKWNGSAWAPGIDTLTLPFSGSANVVGTGAVFSITNTATIGDTYGVFGQNDSASGRGVSGRATATSGINYGVEGRSNSTSGNGVFGWATATSGTTFGVHGLSSSTSGRGVFGYALASSGINYGVYGASNSPDGYGGYFVGRGYFTDYVGIGITSPLYRLDLPNTGSAAGRGRANSWVTYSSGRWKEDIRAIDDPLNLVLQLEGIRYRWRQEQGGTEDLGFIAEEVAKVLPEIVTLEADGVHAAGMDYSRLVPLLVEAMKQQQRQIDALRAEVDALKRKP